MQVHQGAGDAPATVDASPTVEDFDLLIRALSIPSDVVTPTEDNE